MFSMILFYLANYPSLYYILAKPLNFIKKKDDSHRARRAPREINEKNIKKYKFFLCVLCGLSEK